MTKKIILGEIMSHPVITGKASQTVTQAAKLLEKHSIRTLVIVENHTVIGTLSRHDITRAVSEEKDMNTTTINDIMHKGVITATPHMTDIDATRLFVKHKIKKLPILHNEKLVGIVTQTDLLRLATVKWAL